LPYLLYVVAGLITVAWLLMPRKSRLTSGFTTVWNPLRARFFSTPASGLEGCETASSNFMAFATVAIWLAALILEIPYHFSPSVSPVERRAVAVIGESVTAGVGSDESAETWPSLLAREHQVSVQDISHMGETAASALKRARTNS